MKPESNHRASTETSAAPVVNHEIQCDPALDQIRDALRGLKYGVVSIVVQDGVIVQIEKTEKRRLR